MAIGYTVADYPMFQASHSNDNPGHNFPMVLLLVQTMLELYCRRGIEAKVVVGGAHMDTCGGVGRPRCVTHGGHRLVTHYTAVLLHGVQRLVGHYSITGRAKLG